MEDHSALRQEALRLHTEDGLNIHKLSIQLDIPKAVLWEWIKENHTEWLKNKDHKPSGEDFLDEDGILTDDYFDPDHLMWVQFKRGFSPREVEGFVEITDEDSLFFGGYLFDDVVPVRWDRGYYFTELEVPFDWMYYGRDELLKQEVENNNLEMEWIDVENSETIR